MGCVRWWPGTDSGSPCRLNTRNLLNLRSSRSSKSACTWHSSGTLLEVVGFALPGRITKGHRSAAVPGEVNFFATIVRSQFIWRCCEPQNLYGPVLVEGYRRSRSMLCSPSFQRCVDSDQGLSRPAHLSEVAFQNWIAGTKHGSLKGDELTVLVPDEPTESWIQFQYTREISEAIEDLGLPITAIQYDVKRS